MPETGESVGDAVGQVGNRYLDLQEKWGGIGVIVTILFAILGIGGTLLFARMSWKSFEDFDKKEKEHWPK